MRRHLLFVIALALVVVSFAACGGESENGSESAPEPSPTPTAEVTPTPAEASPEETAGSGSDVRAAADEIVSCLDDAGIEADFEKADFPTYEEAGTVDVTFEYKDLGIKVPGAVTLYLHGSEQGAAETLKGINDNLLQGDTKAKQEGTIVIDDFGTTLQEPEAAEQAEALQSCLT